jgi:hypothetical protein
MKSRSRLVGMCGSVTLVAVLTVLAFVSHSTADDVLSDIMTPDWHFFDSDFVGVITVTEAVVVPPTASTPPQRHFSMVVEDVWTDRWGRSRGDEIDFRTSDEIRPFDSTGRYLVLLRGGPFADAPLTYGMNSVFRIYSDRSIACGDGTTLYAVRASGFLCSIPLLVLGEPATLSTIREQFVRRAEIARSRLERTEGALRRDRRPLYAAPLEVTP